VPSPKGEPFVVDRYAVYEEFAAGGMASVHYGLWLREGGFSRPVAIKRLHRDLAKDAKFVAAFIEEARIASRVRHPNVVTTLDVVSANGELLLVTELVEGESLMRLLGEASEKAARPPLGVTIAVIAAMLRGLHAAHTATDERGAPLHLVHRDVSPHNVMIGIDGTVRVIDFGIAKAQASASDTREGQLKGKLAYMAPERLKGDAIRASDVYSAGVCLWEMLTVERLFRADNPSVVLARIAAGMVDPPSKHAPEVPPALDAIVLRALATDPAARFSTAAEMATALEAAVPPAVPSDVGAWVSTWTGAVVDERARRMAEIERTASATLTSPESKRSSRWGSAPLAWALVILFIGGGALAFLFIVTRQTKAPAPAASTASSASSEPRPSDTPIATTIPSVTPTTTTPASATHTGARPQPTHTARPSCDPPYVVDPDGVRRYKKECFKP
jgi:serine/threonine-protein kinase